MNRRIKPPKIAQYILRMISKPEERFSAAGDFEEIYSEINRRKGKPHALFWYWIGFGLFLFLHGAVVLAVF